MPRRTAAICLLGLSVAFAVGCRQSLNFDYGLTADPQRGSRLFSENCANVCHPDNAFQKRGVKNYEQLAYKVRDYYEQAAGDQDDITQDVFDLTRYLNDTYYHYRIHM
jgi:hypothetical protein